MITTDIYREAIKRTFADLYQFAEKPAVAKPSPSFVVGFRAV